MKQNMPRPRPTPPQNNAVRSMYCIAVLQENGGTYSLMFFKDLKSKSEAIDKWLKTGRLYRDGTAFTTPYAIGNFGKSQFFFNLEHGKG